MSAHAIHTRHESVVGEYLTALVSEAVIGLMRLLTFVSRLIVGPRFVDYVRPESGVDEPYVDELHDANRQLIEDREFGLYSGVDLIADAHTGPFTAVDVADASPRVAKAYAIAATLAEVTR